MAFLGCDSLPTSLSKMLRTLKVTQAGAAFPCGTRLALCPERLRGRTLLSITQRRSGGRQWGGNGPVAVGGRSTWAPEGCQAQGARDPIPAAGGGMNQRRRQEQAQSGRRRGGCPA